MFTAVYRAFSAIVLLAVLVGCASLPPEDVATNSAGTLSDSVASTAFQSEEDYILGQGDEISILVFDEPDLTLDARVGGSGFINYSYLGNIQVANKTPLQLEKHIAELLRNGYLVNPAVNVAVKNFRPFYIGGEVRSPGSYPYQPGLTLERAITLAGGLTERASTRRMFVIKSGSSEGQRKISMSEPVGPGDSVTIQEGFF